MPGVLPTGVRPAPKTFFGGGTGATSPLVSGAQGLAGTGMTTGTSSPYQRAPKLTRLSPTLDPNRDTLATSLGNGTIRQMPTEAPSGTSSPGAGAGAPGAGGVLSGPGAYEQWAPGAASQFNGPSNVETLYGSGNTGVLNTSRSAGLGDVSGGVYQDWAAQNKGAFANPGQRETFANTTGRQLAGPGMLEANAGGLAGRFSDPSLRENLAGRLGGELRGPSNAQQIYGQVRGSLSGDGSVNKRFDQMGDSFDQQGALENWSDQYAADPMKASRSELLYDSGHGGLADHYDYAAKRAMDATQRASAARGGFNSGQASFAENDIMRQIRGEEAQNKASLAGQADSAERTRYAQGQGFAQDEGNAYRQRIMDAFGLSQADDQSTLDRATGLSGIARGADASEATRRGQALDVATAGDQGELQRTGAQADIYGAADAGTRARIGLGSDIAAGADRGMLDRMGAAGDMQYRSEGLAAGQATENRMRAGAADSEQRQRLNDLYGYAAGSDAAKTGRVDTQGKILGTQQTMGENRLAGALGATSSLDSREAGLVKDILGNTQGIENMDDTQLQALAEKYGIPLEKRNDFVQLLKDGAKIAAHIP